jgi:hypothetical protein
MFSSKEANSSPKARVKAVMPSAGRDSPQIDAPV